MKNAVVEVGGKQFLVQKDDEIIVQNLNQKVGDTIDLSILMTFEDENVLEIGSPFLKSTAKAEVLENLKGEKLRVARFKSKVRYRKVTGFRSQLTKIKIKSI